MNVLPKMKTKQNKATQKTEEKRITVCKCYISSTEHKTILRMDFKPFSIEFNYFRNLKYIIIDIRYRVKIYI